MAARLRTARHLREIAAQMDVSGYLDNCVVHADRIARLLLEDGGAPWIGRIRDVVITDTYRLHNALIPIRLAGKHPKTWTTHYVCCEGSIAYDPLVGEPIAIDQLALHVFGRTLEMREALSARDVKALIESGSRLRSSILNS